jgi:hypothetical protein
MNSYWIERQARQRIDEFAAEARGPQLIRNAEAATARRTTFSRRPSPRPRAWLDTLIARSRRPVAR